MSLGDAPICPPWSWLVLLILVPSTSPIIMEKVLMPGCYTFSTLAYVRFTEVLRHSLFISAESLILAIEGMTSVALSKSTNAQGILHYWTVTLSLRVSWNLKSTPSGST
jgi:hypothetical protein